MSAVRTQVKASVVALARLFWEISTAPSAYLEVDNWLHYSDSELDSKVLLSTWSGKLFARRDVRLRCAHSRVPRSWRSFGRILDHAFQSTSWQILFQCGWGDFSHHRASHLLSCLNLQAPCPQISASVVALARLLYEFSTTLSHTIPDLLPSVLMLLRTKSREVIKSILGFVKVGDQGPGSRTSMSHVE